MNNIFGEILSFVGDLSPLGNWKSLFEAFSGKDFITRQKLNYFERGMCIIGAIPFAGNVVKLFKRCKPLVRGFNRVKRISKEISKYNDDKISPAKLGWSIGTKIGEAIGGFQDTICEIADFVRYDNNLGALAIRIIDGAACGVTAPVINLAQNTAKTALYGAGKIIGRSSDEIDQSLDKMKDNFSTQYDGIINKLSEVGYNGRFWHDIATPFAHVIAYYNMSSLTNEALEKIRGLEIEAARRYRSNKEKEKEEIYPDNPKWSEKNKEREKFNRALDKARQKVINDDLKKNKDKIPNNNIFPFFGGSFGLLGGLFDYFRRLFGNLWWLMKQDLINYWKNKFGNGGYGFHTCPYGCGRPIPDSFRGCTELLAAFPDYFN